MIRKRKNAVLAAAGMMLIATAFTLAMSHISASISSARVNGANAVTQVEVFLTSDKAGDKSQYTIKFETSPTGAIPAEGGQINIQFPKGTSFSSSMAANSIDVAANAGTKSLTIPPVINSRTVSLTTPIALANSDSITVTFALTAGLKNPAIWQSYGSVASNRPLNVTTSRFAALLLVVRGDASALNTIKTARCISRLVSQLGTSCQRSPSHSRRNPRHRIGAETKAALVKQVKSATFGGCWPD